MSIASLVDLESATVEDPFDLDVRVITDVPSGHPQAPCTTNDGCAPTCASACVSGGV